MDELITWLRAQLDDDERAIERMRSEPMHGVESGAEEDFLMFAYRAPAEVEAKRRMLAMVDEERAALARNGYQPTAVSPALARLISVCRLLAQPYAGRPGWQEEWCAEG